MMRPTENHPQIEILATPLWKTTMLLLKMMSSSIKAAVTLMLSLFFCGHLELDWALCRLLVSLMEVVVYKARFPF